jgi:linoleoyl-CoA desaturase
VRQFIGNRRTVDSPAMYAKAFGLIAAAVGAYIVLVFQAESVVTVAASATVLALAMVGIGFNVQHDGNHGTFSKHVWVNRAAGFTLDLMGASSYFWGDKHNHNHHVHTNITHEDADIDLGPLARMAEDQPWYWWHRYQHLYLWVLYTMVHLRYLWSDFQRMALGKNDGLTAGYPKGGDFIAILLGKAFFVTFAFIVPMSIHPIGRVIGIYVLVSMTMGVLFSVVFQCAHSVDIVEHPRTTETAHPEWVVHQINTTANFATSSRVLTYLLGGLNYQREHHLYPRIAHAHYPAIAKIVKEFCREHGVECRENKTFPIAIRSHYRYIRRLGVEPQPEPGLASQLQVNPGV